ncbi:MAG: hypothetical protein MUC43_18695, partial [Pirellula sp.]|nr:hypothetical protein [Pirellula sp.]
MDKENPYSVNMTTAGSSERESITSVTPSQKLFIFLLFLIVTFLIWLSLMFTFFANSSAYWPGFACTIPALTAAYLLCRSHFIRAMAANFQTAILVSSLSTGFLVWMSS